MFDAASSRRRAPLPPAQSSASGVPGPRAPQSPQSGKQRDAFFDNAKYLAIVLVAIGHAWDPLKGGSRAAEGAYIVVYAFHMPAFIIISGFFSRGFDLRPGRRSGSSPVSPCRTSSSRRHIRSSSGSRAKTRAMT
ncbi:hypothetical protein SGLAM104S_06176 [Streptomyces glaucescens]